MKITVTTPTGHIGGALTERLLSGGQRVTLLVRNPSKVAHFTARGARAVQGDQKDASAIARALDDAEALFWLSPPDYRSPNLRRHTNETADALIAALGGHTDLRIVNLSSVGAQLAEGTGPIKGLHDTERKLDASGARVTHLRADYFMENVLSSLGAIAGQGAIYSTVPGSVATRQVATRDIAEVAAQLLLDPSAAGKVVNVCGPEAITFDQVAAILSKFSGLRISHAQIPADAARAAVIGSGLSEDFADQLLELEAAMAKSLLLPEPGLPVRYGSTTFAQFAREVVVPALLEASHKPEQG